MNNFFLLNEAVRAVDLLNFENGVKELTIVASKRKSNTDHFFRWADFWTQLTENGYMYEVPAKLNGELVGLSVKLFDSFTPIEIDILNENDFDILFEHDCNGFMGFNFHNTAILPERRITNLEHFNTFRLNCAQGTAYNSIPEFWENKELLFPKLVFCDRVLRQIEHLSTNDDRFTLIVEKLIKLNSFTDKWTEGVFNYKNLGLDNSPDTPNRIANTLALRTFDCPEIGQQVFNLHIKWYFGSEPFRLYYYPYAENKLVYVGFIGPKADIGF